ncbi:MAG: hypothetical protein IT323_14985, partial [Anaerolineae bacterium]|nr:hypothetical protein [Anaerolineae bacterium]
MSSRRTSAPVRAGRRAWITLVILAALLALAGNLALAQDDAPRNLTVGETVSG